MRRGFRFVLGCLAALSLVACVGTAVLWVRGRDRTDDVSFPVVRGGIGGVISSRGRLALWIDRGAFRTSRVGLQHAAWDGAMPGWVGSVAADDLLGHWSDEVLSARPTLTAVEVHPLDWPVACDDRLGRTTYLTFHPSVDAHLRKGSRLAVVDVRTLRTVGTVQVDRCEVDVQRLDTDLLEEFDGSRVKAMGAGDKLWAIGPFSGSLPPAYVRPWLRVVAGEAPVMVRRDVVALNRFRFIDGVAWGRRRTVVFVPHAAVVAVTGLLAMPLAWRVRRWVRRRYRARRGLCVACGYSLVGNVSGVCPECGVAREAR